jgi:hypothetical protein
VQDSDRSVLGLPRRTTHSVIRQGHAFRARHDPARAARTAITFSADRSRCRAACA